MYSLIRLLLPMIDRDESGSNVLYHMKERGITSLFVRALGLEGTVSAKKLQYWKKPEGGDGWGHVS